MPFNQAKTCGNSRQIPYVLIGKILFVLTHGRAHGQVSSQHPPSQPPSSITAYREFKEKPSSSVQPEPLDPVATTPCGLRVLETIPQATGEAIGPTNEPLALAVR